MNCKQVRECVSSYLDDELSTVQSESFRRHLNLCETCRQFETEMRRQIVEPFQSGCVMEVSEIKVWEDLKREIEHSEQPKAGFDFEQFIKRLQWEPKFGFRPVFAFVLLTFILLFVLRFPTGLTSVARQSKPEYIDYMIDELAFTDLNSGYETNIEEYFL